MQKKLLIMMIFIVFAIILFVPSCFAATATISANKTEVKAGDTVEVYIDLGIQSIAYDLRVSINDSSLIKERKMSSETGKGTVDRIYLVQVVSEEERIIYEPGTRLAKFEYTLADDITENKTLEITVSGDIAGKDSSEKNTVNETISILVTPKVNEEQNEDKTEEETKEDIKEEKKENEKVDSEEPKDNKQDKDKINPEEPKSNEQNTEKTDIEEPKKDNSNVDNNKLQEDTIEKDGPSKIVRIDPTDTQKTTDTSKIISNSNKEKPTQLPHTGNEYGIILIISGLVLLQIAIIIGYKKINFKNKG